MTCDWPARCPKTPLKICGLCFGRHAPNLVAFFSPNTVRHMPLCRICLLFSSYCITPWFAEAQCDRERQTETDRQAETETETKRGVDQNGEERRTGKDNGKEKQCHTKREINEKSTRNQREIKLSL